MNKLISKIKFVKNFQIPFYRKVKEQNPATLVNIQYFKIPGLFYYENFKGNWENKTIVIQRGKTKLFNEATWNG